MIDPTEKYKCPYPLCNFRSRLKMTLTQHIREEHKRQGLMEEWNSEIESRKREAISA